MSEPYHYLDRPRNEPQECAATCRGCECCSDAYGVDAIKDANAEAGRDPYDNRGYYEAKARGWFRPR
jgi:hypothetical protein